VQLLLEAASAASRTPSVRALVRSAATSIAALPGDLASSVGDLASSAVGGRGKRRHPHLPTTHPLAAAALPQCAGQPVHC
jgi:hypothetical protein